MFLFYCDRIENKSVRNLVPSNWTTVGDAASIFLVALSVKRTSKPQCHCLLPCTLKPAYFHPTVPAPHGTSVTPKALQALTLPDASTLDHVTVAELHGLRTLRPQLTSHDHLIGQKDPR